MNLELDEADKAALVALLRFPLSPRIRQLRAILDKLEPAKPRPEPYPPPKPVGEPSMVLAKKKRRR
jgi:hypothetical protein